MSKVARYANLYHMYRSLLHELEIWKASNSRKPLILMGARQTGKTYLLQVFGREKYKTFHYFNFEKSAELSAIFEENLDPKRIIDELSLYQSVEIDIEKDLVIFDEIQSIPKALNSLKYFHEDLPVLSLICAGSLLGLQLGKESFPVGKVSFLNLYPMSFEEFVRAVAPAMVLDAYKEIQSKFFTNNRIEISFILHTRLLDLFSEYVFTGGMPEVVKLYCETQELSTLEQRKRIRSLHDSIIVSYENDFAKHSGKVNANHIISVFNNIPLQLSQRIDESVKRFRFKDVIAGKKSFGELEGPINWLVKAGLIIKTGICNRIEDPVVAFTSPNIFKLYYFDIGLLSTQLSLPFSYKISSDKGISKGYIAENFVAQELNILERRQLSSWSERNSEIEFILSSDESGIFPVEVKSSNRVKAKSLNEYFKKYDPSVAYILSTRNYSRSDKLVYLPIYLVDLLKK